VRFDSLSIKEITLSIIFLFYTFILKMEYTILIIGFYFNRLYLNDKEWIPCVRRA
jgi:hypothetical protein